MGHMHFAGIICTYMCKLALHLSLLITSAVLNMKKISSEQETDGIQIIPKKLLIEAPNTTGSQRVGQAIYINPLTKEGKKNGLLL